MTEEKVIVTGEEILLDFLKKAEANLYDAYNAAVDSWADRKLSEDMKNRIGAAWSEVFMAKNELEKKRDN